MPTMSTTEPKKGEFNAHYYWADAHRGDPKARRLIELAKRYGVSKDPAARIELIELCIQIELDSSFQKDNPEYRPMIDAVVTAVEKREAKQGTATVVDKFAKTEHKALWDELTVAQKAAVEAVNQFFDHAKGIVQNSDTTAGEDEVEQFKIELGARKERIAEVMEEHLSKIRERYNKYIEEIPPF